MNRNCWPRSQEHAEALSPPATNGNLVVGAPLIGRPEVVQLPAVVVPVLLLAAPTALARHCPAWSRSLARKAFPRNGFADCGELQAGKTDSQ
jgi:hypothetical protein